MGGKLNFFVFASSNHAEGPKDMKCDRNEMEATIGVLMRAASEIAFERSEDTVEAFALSNFVLIEMIRRRFAPSWQRGELFGDAPPGSSFN